MPTYEYQCNACDHQFETFQSMKDNALRKCPECKKNTLERLVSGGTGFILKGPGFWKNDSKSRNKAAADTSKTESGEKSGSDSKEAKSESKESVNEKPADKKPAKSKSSKE